MKKKKRTKPNRTLIDSPHFWFMMGFILGVILIMSYLLVKFYLIQPRTINFRSDGKIVYFNEEVIDYLNSQYKDFTIERAFCLGGTSGTNEINILNIDEIITETLGTETSLNLSGGECLNIEDKDIMGIIHFHPEWKPNSCIHNKNDILSFGKNSESVLIEPNNLEIWGVQCGINKISIIDFYNLEESLRWDVI